MDILKVYGYHFVSKRSKILHIITLLEHGKACRMHDLPGIAEMIEEELNVSTSEIVNDLRELTIHYTIARYPNAANTLPSELYDERKARELIERAKGVLEWVKQHLR